MEPLGLYIHIPFCKSKCAYCDFYSLPGCTEERMDAYTEALCTHLRAFAVRLRETERGGAAACTGISDAETCTEMDDGAQADGKRGYTVDTVYFGGGTPSLLGERRLLDLWETVLREYPVAADAEVTLEANPDSCGPWLASLQNAGFNRLSLGMQSADDGELREIGRVHTAAQTRAAVETVRRAGFHNLSLDLIYGLPRQTMEGWLGNVRAALDLGPEHLSCYGLKVEPGTPLYSRRETAELPGEEDQADDYLRAVEELDRAGYQQYEISNFARPGRESRHNLKYWTLAPYAGFGPGAHSDFGGARYAWDRDLDGYLRAVRDCLAPEGIRAGQPFPYGEYAEITPVGQAREWMMLGLRTAAGLDRGEYDRKFGGTGGQTAEPDGIPPFDRFVPFLEQCRRAGYAVRKGDRWRLTPRGFLVSNQIIGRLLEAWDA